MTPSRLIDQITGLVAPLIALTLRFVQRSACECPWCVVRLEGGHPDLAPLISTAQTRLHLASDEPCEILKIVEGSVVNGPHRNQPAKAFTVAEKRAFRSTPRARRAVDGTRALADRDPVSTTHEPQAPSTKRRL